MKIKKLDTENLEYGNVSTLSYANIVEVAIRHGFDSELKDEFKMYCESLIDAHISYREWEKDMGDEL